MPIKIGQSYIKTLGNAHFSFRGNISKYDSVKFLSAVTVKVFLDLNKI